MRKVVLQMSPVFFLAFVAGSCGGSSAPDPVAPDVSAAPVLSQSAPEEEGGALSGFRNTQKRKDIVAQLIIGRPLWKDYSTSEVLFDKNAHWTFTNYLMGRDNKFVSIPAASVDGVPKRNISDRISKAPGKLVFAKRHQSEQLLESFLRIPNRVPEEIEEFIVARGEEDYWIYIFGFTAENKVRSVFVVRGKERSTGTCFAINRDTIITANHVVDGAVSQTVQFEGETARWARLLKYSKKSDIAILRIKTPRKAPGLAIQPDPSLELGNEIFTVGFPQPRLQGWSPKYTEGTISSTKGHQDSPLFFQMSIPVQPGNSGGPVLDSKGRVVGIVTHGLKKAQVANYAANTKHLLGMLERLSTKPEPSRPHKSRRAAIAAVEKAVCKVRTYGQQSPKK